MILSLTDGTLFKEDKCTVFRERRKPVKVLKTVSLIAFIIALLLLAADIAAAVYGFFDLNSALNILEQSDTASGVDYFGLGWALGAGLFAVSLSGVGFSSFAFKFSDGKLKIASAVMIFCFAVLLLVGTAVFFAF